MKADPETQSSSARPSFHGISVLWIVLAFAGVVRVAMLIDFVYSHPGAYLVQGDSAAYWSMAGELAGGKLISDEPYLSAPLYAYFLGLIRWLGGGLLSVYLAQITVHLLTGYLLGRMVSRMAGQRAGIITSALFLLMLEPAFYVTRVLPTTVQLGVVAWVLFSAEQAARTRAWREYLALAVGLGLFVLIYPSAIVLIVVLPAWVVWNELQVKENTPVRRSAWLDAAWEKGAVSIIVACLVVAPATLHNWAASKEFIPVTAHGGITLWQGHAEGADGVYTPIPGISATRDRMHADAQKYYRRATSKSGGFGEMDAFFRKQAWKDASADARRAAWLAARKVYWFFTGRHYADIAYPTLEQKDGWIHLLPLAPVKTAWLFGAALIGAIVLRRMARPHDWLYLLVVVPLVTVAVFWYSPRYRAPVIPPLVCFAALAAEWARRDEIMRTLGKSSYSVSRRWMLLFGVTSVSMLTGPINTWSGFDRVEAYRPQYEYNRGQVYVALGQLTPAIQHFEDALRLDPERAPTLVALVDAYARTDQFDRAEETARRLIALNPIDPAPWLALGGLYLRGARYDAAAAAFQEALKRAPREAQAHVGIAMALAHVPEQHAQVESHFKAARRLAPRLPLVVCEYGRWLFEQGRRSEAQAFLKQCVKLVPDRSDTARMWAELSGTSTKETEEIAVLRAALKAEPGEAEGYSQLAGALFADGRFQEAIDVLRTGLAAATDRSTLPWELAWVLATTPASLLGGDVGALRKDALTIAEEALDDAAESSPERLDVLAAALAANGRFADAAALAQRAYNLAVARDSAELAAAIGDRLKLYAAEKAYVRE